MQNIFSAINYKYPLPLNYEAENPDFDIFKNFPDEKCLAPKIEFLKKIRISNNSVVFRYFKIFKKSCINAQTYEKYQKGFGFFLKFIFPQFNFSKKRFLLISDEWTSNYYHWHIFALQKLLLLKEKNFIENSLLILPKKYQSYKFVLPSLEKFGIKKNQIVFLRKKSNIKVAELPLVEVSRQRPSAFRQINKILTQNTTKINHDFGEKIYISREEQVLRFVENEQEVVTMLEKYGFKKIIMEKFSYDEQIAICSKAKYLISPHGAGLTNVLFMKEGSYVLEMSTPQTAAGFNRDFYALSSMLGLNYLYQKCAMGKNSRVQDFHQASLMVDLTKLEKNLKLMLGHALKL